MEKNSDTYKSFASTTTGIFKDKGSKFLAFGFPIKNEDQVKEIIIELKKKYHDARHHCYAYCIGINRDIFRMNDDGEPSGTAGKPIYGQILSHNLSDVLIVVVRYFGGTLLGTSRLINAYKNAANYCIQNAHIIDHVVEIDFRIRFGYELLNQVMKLIKDYNLTQIDQNYTGTECNFHLSVRMSDYNSIIKKIKNIYGIDIMDNKDL